MLAVMTSAYLIEQRAAANMPLLSGNTVLKRQEIRFGSFFLFLQNESHIHSALQMINKNISASSKVFNFRTNYVSQDVQHTCTTVKKKRLLL